MGKLQSDIFDLNTVLGSLLNGFMRTADVSDEHVSAACSVPLQAQCVLSHIVEQKVVNGFCYSQLPLQVSVPLLEI